MQLPTIPPGEAKSQATRLYVQSMMEVIGRAMEAASEVDPVVKEEISRLPEQFSFEMKVLPAGPGFAMQKNSRGHLELLSGTLTQKPVISIQFKHLAHAFLVLSFQEGTARAFANDRMVCDGELGYALKLIRCLNQLETCILPKFVAEKAVKRYPDITVVKKVFGGSRIYRQLAKNLIRGKQHV